MIAYQTGMMLVRRPLAAANGYPHRLILTARDMDEDDGTLPTTWTAQSEGGGLGTYNERILARFYRPFWMQPGDQMVGLHVEEPLETMRVVSLMVSRGVASNGISTAGVCQPGGGIARTFSPVQVENLAVHYGACTGPQIVLLNAKDGTL